MNPVFVAALVAGAWYLYQSHTGLPAGIPESHRLDWEYAKKAGLTPRQWRQQGLSRTPPGTVRTLGF